MQSMKNQIDTGKLGENAVSEYLENAGYKILSRNYRIRGGEIDIIASYGEYIIFVEVKTRKPDSMVSGLDAVNQKKRNLIIKTATDYLLKYPCSLQPRFDVAEVTALDGQILYINYLQNAFDLTGYNF